MSQNIKRRKRKLICDKCKRDTMTVQMFENQWLCMDCWNKANNVRESKYYQELFEKSKKIK